MSLSSSHNQLMDLLIARTIRGLRPGEETALTALRSALRQEDDRSFDYTIAMIDSAMTSNGSQLPARLRSRVVSDAQRFINQRLHHGLLYNADTIQPRSCARTRPREIVAWLAFAASVILAAFLWLSSPTESAPLTVAQLEMVRDLKQIELQPTEDPSTQSLESAEVLWSDSLQQGFVRCRGLAVNDPAVEQYQLWIIDRERGFHQRVDGGVFNISSNAGEVVPVRAKLNVSDAAAFAVTREIPGGVVVSDLQQVALLSENAVD